jgi:carbon storage regulator
MLVLTRKPGETVCIGTDIELVVLDAGRGRVKLGFAGPRNVPIRRGELDAAGSETADRREPCASANESRIPRLLSAVPTAAPLHSFRVAAGT